MTIKEECIEFKNIDGLILRGILHHGNGSVYKKITLICLNTGLNDMVGWHRLQVKNARFFAENGFNVLRFDDTGIGDSEGEIEETSIVQIFSSIESGMFVKNADAATSYMQSIFPTEKFIYLGYCGGGLTGIHSAAVNRKITAVINIGGPITLASDEYLQKKDPWVTRKNIKKYKSKIFQLRPWMTFFMGKGEYREILQSLIYYAKHRIKGEYKGSVSYEEIDRAKNLNRRFFRSFETYITSKRPTLFYYAELDSATWELKKYFLDRYKSSSIWKNGRATFIEIEKANHIFSDVSSQDRMKKDILDWLTAL